ncbi:MAG: sulfite exporter TauE/SafE family protein [Granulosicoccus sp.]|nr:sulfite exporter TauE/SafE family protein [Granulosicoccus sp.]
MLAQLQNLVSLSSTELAICLAVLLAAGMVRGFAGFGLSALTMAGLTLIMPPVTLIPVCFMLEAVASIMMFRGGLRLADRRISLGLALGSAIGIPIGLAATITVPTDISRMIALGLILVLSLLQLLKASPAFLATRPGLYAAGLTAGIATGLASVGGMVVALYVLAQNAAAPRMRASLVLYLFLGMFASAVWLSFSGLLDTLALRRALVFAPVVMLGVVLGTALFRPSLEQFYRRFCLGLLMTLATVGLLRLALT